MHAIKREWSMVERRSYLSAAAMILMPFVFAGPMQIDSFAETPPDPAWWQAWDVLNPEELNNDFAAVNMGQLKWMAWQAAGYLSDNLPTGAGMELRATLSAWFDDDFNYAAVTVGQLKHVGSLYYDCLITNGFAHVYPWTFSPYESDFAVANVGQVKHVFSFVVDDAPDFDGDGLPDWWEMQIINADPFDIIEIIEHVLPDDDFDGDGISNADEYRFGTDPTDPDSKPPLLGFSETERTVLEKDDVVDVMIELTLFPPAAVSVTGRVAVVAHTAMPLIDFELMIADAEFAPGETTASVLLEIRPDTDHCEGREYVILGIVEIFGPALVASPAEHVVYIEDDAEDSDSDGLPDWWELLHFGTATGANPDDDPDEDGWTNIEEYLRCGDPWVPWSEDESGSLPLELLTPVSE